MARGLLLSACLLLVACGGDAVPNPAAAGRTLHTGAFSVQVPAGFTVADDDARTAAALHAPGAVLVLLEQRVPAGGDAVVVSTLWVARIPSGPIPPGAMAAYLGNVRDSGATDVGRVQPLSVDGEVGMELTYGHTLGPVAARTADVVVSHGSKSFEVVLDTAAAEFPLQLAALTEVLRTWRWTPAGASPPPPH